MVWNQMQEGPCDGLQGASSRWNAHPWKDPHHGAERPSILTGSDASKFSLIPSHLFGMLSKKCLYKREPVYTVTWNSTKHELMSTGEDAIEQVTASVQSAGPCRSKRTASLELRELDHGQ